MKKMLILLIVMLMYQYNTCLSYNWEISNSPPPCGTGWTGPKEALVCELQSCADPECCYRVIYYDRWTGANENEYEISIVGVYWSTPACSSACSSMQVAESAYFPLLKSISNGDPDFRDRVMSAGRGPYGCGTEENGSYIYIYGRATCKTTQGEACLHEEFCCSRKYGIAFGDGEGGEPEHQVCTMYCTWGNFDIIPTNIVCEPPCEITCYDDLKYTLDPDPCDLCDETYTWREMPIQSIQVNCCPSCPDQILCTGCSYETITVYFIYEIRVGPYGSECIYKDYRLKKWWYEDDNHCSENDEVKIHSKIYGWILNWGYLTNPVQDDSVTNVRMTEAECWRGVWKWDQSDPPKLITEWKECEDNVYCCQKVWKVKNYGPPIGIISTLISSTPPGSQNCLLDIGYMYQLCQSFCESDPRQFWGRIPDIENEENFKQAINPESVKISVKPNPSKGMFELFIDSPIGGEIIFKLNDLNGNTKIEQTFNYDSNNKEFKINASALPKGVYFYQAIFNGKSICNNCKIIID